MSIPVPVPKANRHGEFKTPPHPPVPARTHIANRYIESGEPTHINVECGECGVLADHPVDGPEGNDYWRVICLECGMVAAYVPGFD